MKKYIYLSIFIVGCYSVKKATKDLNKIHEYYPEVVAKKSMEWYPCIPLQIKSDSTQYKEWLRSFDSINNLYFGLMSQLPETLNIEIHDTVKEKCLDKQAIIKYREVIKKMPSIHDTMYKLDSSRNFVLMKDKEDCESNRLAILNSYLEFKSYLLWAIILLCISIVLNILQYKLKR